MITATKERPTAAELIQKHRQEVFTRYQEFIADIDRRMGNRAELKEAELEMAADSLIFNYFCFPYFEQCIKWKYDIFPNADAEFSNVTPFELTNTIVYPYIFSVFGQNISENLSQQYKEHPEQAEKPLTGSETELFMSYLEDVAKPALSEILEDIRAGKYKTLDEIEEEITNTFPNTKLKEIFADKEKNNIFLSMSREQYKPRNDFNDLLAKYAKFNGFSDKLHKREYTRVFSNPLALSVMNMYTSEEIRGNKSVNLLDDVPKKTYKPRRRDDHKGIITEIVIEAIEGGKITACWGATEKRIFALYNEFICKSGSNLNSPFVITLDDYIKKCGLSSSASAKKETRKNVKNALFSLLHTSISNTENQNLYVGVNLFQTAVLSNNTIFIMGSYPLVEALSEKNQTMFLPPEYFTYKGKDAVSFMNIVQTLCYNYGNYNNVNAADKFKNHRNEKISVKSLLASTDIVTIKEIEKRRISWKQKIKEPLEAKLNTFPGADNWNYMYNDKPITAENLPNTLTYNEWEQLVIRYDIGSFPLETVTEAIAKKKERVQQKLQIQADQAAIARDRSEQRQERKARKAKKKPE